jgi:hypothetical protein
MEADLNLAISAGMKLALRYRVVTDDDLLDHLPDMPRRIRNRAFDRLINDGILHPRRGRSGYDSSAYVGLM